MPKFQTNFGIRRKYFNSKNLSYATLHIPPDGSFQLLPPQMGFDEI